MPNARIETTGVYNLFDRSNHLVTFVPDRAGHGFTDPSYQLPAFLDYWAKVAAKDRKFWKEAAKAARQHLIVSADPTTGLYPEKLPDENEWSNLRSVS